MDPPGDESGITQYRVQENLKYGMIGEEEKHYDLAQAVMVYISSKSEIQGIASCAFSMNFSNPMTTQQGK